MDAIEAKGLREASERAAVEAATAALASHAEGAHYDAGFDGGEFSGPAHGRALDAELEAIAGRHGLTAERLWELVYADAFGDGDPEACPGCGARPGDGLTAGCDHPEGCGHWREVQR